MDAPFQPPPWLDPSEYPFAHRSLDLPSGRMHYVDEGQGEPIVMVHGIPTWSFLYRGLIRELSGRFRCIAPDNLGFGLSAKPRATHRVADHSADLQRFVEALDLRDVTLVVHDFGGPIGLGYAVRHPENVRRLVILNTWMWPVHELRYRALQAMIASPVGRLLYERLNFSVRVLMAFGRSRLTPIAKRHYRAATASPDGRHATWVLGTELTGANDFYAALWENHAVLRDKPALVVWGLRDTAFRRVDLERLRSAFAAPEVVEYADAGHFLPEEKAEDMASHIARLMERRP